MQAPTHSAARLWPQANFEKHQRIISCEEAAILTSWGLPLEVSTENLAPVVQKMDNTIHWINLYPLYSKIGSPNTYPLDSDLSSE